MGKQYQIITVKKEFEAQAYPVLIAPANEAYKWLTKLCGESERSRQNNSKSKCIYAYVWNKYLF